MDRQDQDKAAAEDKTCSLALLPDDVLADVLRRLPPRGLAVSRCVCKALLAVVDGRRMLRADLLPLSLGGFFMNFHNLYISEFFAPVSGPSISGKHNYLPDESVSASWGYLDDHCNGLVLIHDYDDNVDEIGYVLNPATRWLARLPPCPPPPIEIKDTFQFEYLAYDPTESPYYEVVSVTRSRKLKRYLYDSSKDAVEPEIEEYEWPPLVWILNVFSSRTGQWEQRSFARESDSIGTVSGIRPDWPNDHRNAVYWRGALYVHCKTECVIRLSLMSAKYHVIKPPPGTEVRHHPQFYLGKSSKGVYCASIEGRCRIQVWNLDESGCRMEWILKHDSDLSKWLLKQRLEYSRSRPCGSYGPKIQEPWALQDINYYHYNRNIDHNMEAPTEEKVECMLQAPEDEIFTWSSDDECGYYSGYMEILGFHPYKEIIFLRESITRGLAYHLNSCKVEVLGSINPAGYKELPYELLLESSFPYTPCWITQTGDDGE